MSEVVLDASALLALLNEEPGSESVAVAIPQSAISAVNFSEVVAKLNEVGVPEDAIREALDGLNLDVVPFDTEQAFAAGLLRSTTKLLGLGLGDRVCLALAKAQRVPALTADQVWQNLDIGVAVQVIRQLTTSE